MIYGSVCSGIEAATVAWNPLGWKPAWFSEIDKYCCALLKHHYPETPNLGDLTKITEEQLNEQPRINLLVGGTPCQSFSVAGLRAGLDDDRGNLAFEFARIAATIRPRWIVWENVPGVLSSDAGRDFGSILGALAEFGYGFAYRTLDAQYIRTQSHSRAVPQRRKRIFLVGYLGDWRPPAAVLLERESLCGYPAPSRKAMQKVAPTVEASIGKGNTEFAENGGLVAFGGGNTSKDIDVATSVGTKDRCDFTVETFIVESVTPPLRDKAYYDHVGDEEFLIPVASTLQHIGSGGWNVDEAAAGYIIPFDTTQITSAANRSNPTSESPCHSLASGAHPPAITTLSSIRRLTPLECERLQGFPDEYTLVPYNGKPAKDSPRYRALGNSMAVNCMNWIGHRIQLVNDLLKESTNEKV